MTYYVETSRYAFDHNTWRGFDYGASHDCLHLLSDLVKLRESKLWKLCSKSISCIASADISDIICSSGFDIHH